MTPELKPCPFCGGVAKFSEVLDPDDRDFGGHFIYCSTGTCHATSDLRFACGDDPKPLLAEWWNARPGERQAREEALEDAGYAFRDLGLHEAACILMERAEAIRALKPEGE